MKKFLIVTLVMALCLTPMLALADSALRVQGNATLTVAPDTAILSVGYSGESQDSKVAQQQTADAIAAVIEAVKAGGVEEADIVTASLNTYPVYNYLDDGQHLRGYRVDHMLSITVRDLDAVGSLLDAALSAGANQTNSIEYKSSREKDVYLQALALAVENAAAKADALAIATGVWLGSLTEINEVAGYSTLRYAEEAKYDMAAGNSLGSTLMTGDLQVVATVELVYDIR